MTESHTPPDLPSRFAALLDSAPLPAPPAAPPDLRAACVQRLEQLRPEGLLVHDATTAGLQRRLGWALDAAYAQAGERGAALLTDGLRWIGDMVAGDWILHGTGSWALDGILADGRIRAGGDGMTGEVAITGVSEPDVFVLRWQGPLSLYGAAAFAYMNANFRRAGEPDGLALSARRLGRPYIGELLERVVFAADDGPLTPSEMWTRHRTVQRDTHFHAALDRLAELLDRGDTSFATTPLARGLEITDADHALGNLLFAVQVQMQESVSTGATEAERFTAAARQVLTTLRSRLLCPTESDSPAQAAKKASIAAALCQQYPVLFVANAQGLDLHPDPRYPWSDERRLPGALPLARVSHVLAPVAERDALTTRLERAGSQATVLPLEYFEGLRLLAEAPLGSP